jgi:hypothetical protein
MHTKKTYLRFQDFSQEKERLDGAKKRIHEIVNQEILITGYSIGRSKFNGDGNGNESEKNGTYLTLQFEQAGERYVVFTGSEVISDQIERYKEFIPFYTTIRHIDRYYTLS